MLIRCRTVNVSSCPKLILKKITYCIVPRAIFIVCQLTVFFSQTKHSFSGRKSLPLRKAPNVQKYLFQARQNWLDHDHFSSDQTQVFLEQKCKNSRVNFAQSSTIRLTKYNILCLLSNRDGTCKGKLFSCCKLPSSYTFSIEQGSRCGN